MSTSQVSSSIAHSESKSARKKKAKAEAPNQATASPTDPESGIGQTTADGAVTGADASYESPYIKELYKYAHYLLSSGLYNCQADTPSFRNIRNIKKKLVREFVCMFVVEPLTKETLECHPKS